MTPAKMESLTQGLNGVAKKVLEACPLSGPWTTGQIVGEIRRQGHGIEFNVVQGCIARLVEQGLVREPEHGLFVRVAARMRVVAKPEPEPEQPAERAPAHRPEEPANPLDRLGRIAATARSLAEQLAALASEIDSAAIDAEQRVETISADASKLRQLQQLIKSL